MSRGVRRKGTIKNFHPEHYAKGELEAIAMGRAGEAYAFTMRREDVPKGIREKAKKELDRRMRIKKRNIMYGK